MPGMGHAIGQFLVAGFLDDSSEPSLRLGRIGNPQQQKTCFFETAIAGAENALDIMIFVDGVSHDAPYMSDSHRRISVSVMALRSRPCRIRAFRSMPNSDNPG